MLEKIKFYLNEAGYWIWWALGKCFEVGICLLTLGLIIGLFRDMYRDGVILQTFGIVIGIFLGVFLISCAIVCIDKRVKAYELVRNKRIKEQNFKVEGIPKIKVTAESQRTLAEQEAAKDLDIWLEDKNLKHRDF